MKSAGIYVIQNPVGYVYVGQSRDLRKRMSSRKRGDARNQPILSNSFDTYGIENHEITIVLQMSHCCSSSDLDSAEAYYLEMLRHCGHGILNSREAGLRGRHSEETRRKLSLLKHSEESRQKMSKAKTGRKLTDEWKAKISAGGKGRIVSQETKLKMSQSKIGKSNGPLPKETRDKISESVRLRFSDPEVRRALSESKMGRRLSEETKIKIATSNRGKTISEATRQAISESKKGSKASPETKLKMSMSRKGRKLTDETKLKIKNSWVARKLKQNSK